MEIHDLLGFDLKRVFSGSENTSFIHKQLCQTKVKTIGATSRLRDFLVRDLLLILNVTKFT